MKKKEKLSTLDMVMELLMITVLTIAVIVGVTLLFSLLF